MLTKISLIIEDDWLLLAVVSLLEHIGSISLWQ